MNINNYKLKDLVVGLNHSFNVKITCHMMSQFREISGDKNPLHSDISTALSRGYKDCVVFGMLTASFYSRLVGMYLPGKYALLHAIDTSFIAPAFPGDTLTVTGTICAIHTEYKQIEIKAIITNQFTKKISKAKIRTGLCEEK